MALMAVPSQASPPPLSNRWNNARPAATNTARFWQEKHVRSHSYPIFATWMDWKNIKQTFGRMRWWLFWLGTELRYGIAAHNRLQVWDNTRPNALCHANFCLTGKVASLAFTPSRGNLGIVVSNMSEALVRKQTKKKHQHRYIFIIS